MPVTQSRTSHPQSGFTLVVIASLFVAFAVIAAVAIERNTTIQQITRRDDTRAQLQKLSNAIIQYSVFNAASGFNLYPCPALPNVSSTLATFGQSVNDGATPPVDNCSSVDHAGISILTGAAMAPVIVGMVPVQALAPYGIGINDAFDPWNNRIMYVVNRTLTKNGTPTQASNPTLTYPMTGAASPAVPAPDFILISYGKDGVGATKRNSTTVGITCTTPSNVYRLENCEVGDTAFISMPTYTMGDATNSTTLASNSYFDDILVWYRQ